MSFPSDVTLPATAKYIAFVDEKKSYNPNYDIIWSFQYAITGGNTALTQKECAFATFLTVSTPQISAIPGQYLGYSGNMPLSAYLLDENGDYIKSKIRGCYNYKIEYKDLVTFNEHLFFIDQI